MSAFALPSGVPQSILYDNTKLAVARILGDGRRQRTRAFTELQSHYLFEDRFGRPGKGNDKGKVEGLVGYVRRNFLVPIPSFESFDALNAHLERRCLERMDARLRGHTETIGQRMERDLDALLPLPSVPYDACEKQAGRVSSLSLVRYKTNDYSVPVAYGHRDVLVRATWARWSSAAGPRSSPGTPDPMRKTTLYTAPSTTCRCWSGRQERWTRRLRCRDGSCRRSSAHCAVCWSPGWADGASGSMYRCSGCLRSFRMGEVQSAVKDALRLGAISFDAVKHLVLCRLEGRPPRLDLELYPYLPRVRVSTTSAGDYMSLLSRRAA